MRNSYLKKLINKIRKKKGNILYSEQIKKIIKTLMSEEYSDTKAYKLIYYLKNKGYLISLKKNIFYIISPEEKFHEEDIIEKWYRHILHKHCTASLGRKRYIGGKKALEIQYNNFEVPDSILITNEKKQSKEMVVATKSLQFKKYTSKGKVIFTSFNKETVKKKIGKYTFSVATKELALLECLYNHDDMFEKETALMVRKVIKKAKDLDIDIITRLIKTGKHHTSINRLHNIAKEVNKPFAKLLKASIKKYSFMLSL